MQSVDLSKFRPGRHIILAKLSPPKTHDDNGLELAVPEANPWAKVLQVGEDYKGWFNPDKVKPGEYIYVGKARLVIDENEGLIAVKKNEIVVISTNPMF